MAWVIWMKPSSRSAQHLGQAEDVLVDHRVGDHRRAVEVGLHRVRTEALDREAAQPGVHALVQQALHLLALLRRWPGGVLAASRPITYVISDAVGMYWMTFTPFGARSRESRYSGIVSQSQGMPSFIDS